jgi:hypothetical protein
MPKLLILYSLFALVLLTPVALCQSASESTVDESPDMKLNGLLLQVRESNYDPIIGLQAIPALQEAFNKDTTDAPIKASIASVLVMLGQKDDAYWSFLWKRAQEAVDSKAPYPLIYDASGKALRGQTSPEFLQCVKANNLSLNDALNEELAIFPNELELMGTIGDRRGLPLLRKGLSSPNYETRAAAAHGLAVLQDKDSIPLIIEAARNSPSETQWFIAQALVAFDDPEARAAAEELISDKELLADIKQRVREKGARLLLGNRFGLQTSCCN